MATEEEVLIGLDVDPSNLEPTKGRRVLDVESYSREKLLYKTELQPITGSLIIRSLGGLIYSIEYGNGNEFEYEQMELKKKLVEFGIDWRRVEDIVDYIYNFKEARLQLTEPWLVTQLDKNERSELAWHIQY